MRGLRAALSVLTRVPAGALQSDDFRHAPGWFAGVGLLIGCIQALAQALVLPVWGPWLAALAALATAILLTGALHEDGLADTADALGSPRPRERALEILRDSRIGTYGTLALILTLATQTAVLAGLGSMAPAALLAAAALSRVPMAGFLFWGPYLRAQGAASGMTGSWAPSGMAATAGVAGAAIVVGGWVFGLGVIAGLVGMALTAALTGFWARARLGGITGDVLGAVQQAGFTGFLLGVAAWL